MKRWVCKDRKHVELPAVDAFLADLWAVCEKHGLALSHEDLHGGFIVVPLKFGNQGWLEAAAYDDEWNEYYGVNPDGSQIIS